MINNQNVNLIDKLYFMGYNKNYKMNDKEKGEIL